MHWKERTGKRKSIDEVGHAHMLTFSTRRCYRFLAADRTCVWLATALDKARRSHDFSLGAYVFMPDHVHLVIRPGAASSGISDILRAIKRPVGERAMAYLREHTPPSGCRAWRSGVGLASNTSSGSRGAASTATSSSRGRWKR